MSISIFSDKDPLVGQNAIVTGGSRGIGKAIALSLSSLGANVTIAYKSNKDSADQVLSEINNLSKGIAVQTDVNNLENVSNLINNAEKAFGTTTILINNAGITDDALIMRMKEEQWDSVINTNLKGTYNLTKSVLRSMMKEKYGRIINMTSVVAHIGNLGQANYSAAKAGIIGFTKSTAKEVATRGITVNAIAPGFVETDMTKNLSQEQKKLILESIPMRKYATTYNIASAVCYLASKEAAYITGQTINIDGGLVMQ